MAYEPEDDEYGDDLDDDHDSDLHDSSPDYVPCPMCGEDVLEDADWCASCGNFITHSTSVWSGKPIWWIIAGMLGVLATLIMMALV